MLIPLRLLIAAESFGPELPAQAVAEAIGRGLTDAGAPPPDRCPLVLDANDDVPLALGADGHVPLAPGAGPGGSLVPGAAAADDLPGVRTAAGRRELGALLEALEFDRRMRSARAVVVAAARLEERALVGSPAFEISTRARQAGVPAYAVSADSALDPFDARILDLQSVLVAGSVRELRAAGRRLAALS